MGGYERILAAFHGNLWAILPERLLEIAAVLRARAGGAPSIPSVGLRSAPSYDVVNRVAIIPVAGTIVHKGGGMAAESGLASSQAIGQMVDRAAADDAVKSILLAIDSPGGTVAGTPELAAKVKAASQVKRTVALADTMAASAAYWIGSQAREFYSTPSAQVGSIGVIAAHVDQSKLEEMAGLKTTLITSAPFKAELDPSNPLTDEAAGAVAANVQAYHAMFVKAVAEGRGVSVGRVESDFGQGRMKLAADAKTSGMIDGVQTFEQVMKRLGVESGSRSSSPLARDAIAKSIQVDIDTMAQSSYR